MAKRRRDIWACDAPGCPVERVDDGEAPEGFSGTVSTVGGSGCRNAPFYACTTAHITPAITWVARVAHEKVLAMTGAGIPGVVDHRVTTYRNGIVMGTHYISLPAGIRARGFVLAEDRSWCLVLEPEEVDGG